MGKSSGRTWVANVKSWTEGRKALQRVGFEVQAVKLGGLQFIGKVVTAGPNGEADFSDLQHWVKEQSISSTWADKSGGRWIMARNTTLQHFASGTYVLVSVIFENGETYYFIERELSGTPGAGYTGNVTVVTDFNETTCVITTSVLEFTNGLLTDVT